MKHGKRLIRAAVLFVLLAAGAFIAQAQNNSINGHVFDAQSRAPVGDLYVELQDSLGITVTRGRLDSTGRFFFRGLSSGTFNIKVLTLGTNYQETIQQVQLVSLPTGSGRLSSDSVYVDIYLKLDPRRVNSASLGAATIVFAQEVPDEARKLYKKGVEELENKKDAGLETLKKAVEVFPNYYDALDRLGTEYVLRKKYEDAAPYLIRAVEVNKRSFSSFYSIGIVAYNMKKMPEAIEALEAATAINPQSVNAQIFYGMVLRIDGNYEKAEKTLLQAKALAGKTAIPEIHWQLALLYEKTARYPQAADELELYLKANTKAPNEEQVKKLIADLRTRKK